MAQQGKHSGEPSEPATVSTTLVRPPDQSQLDFELDFFARILDHHPNFIDVLRVHGRVMVVVGEESGQSFTAANHPELVVE